MTSFKHLFTMQLFLLSLLLFLSRSKLANILIIFSLTQLKTFLISSENVTLNPELHLKTAIFHTSAEIPPQKSEKLRIIEN